MSYMCVASLLVNLWVYHSVKVLVCLCLCAYAPLCVPEPAPRISGVGLSKHEQSRIKSILILARQEPLLLLGDTSTDTEEKREQTPHLLLLLSSLLSHSFAPSSYPTSFSSFHCLSLSRFLLSFFCSTVLCCPPSLLPLNSSSSIVLSSLSLGLCTIVKSCWHRGTADGPLWSSRQFQDIQWVPGGSLRKPEKNWPSMRRGTNCTLGWYGPFYHSILF